jgi:hypothetical protein
MEEPQKECGCPECEKRAAIEKEYEEVSLAFLLALMPMMVITLFGQIGFF